MTTLFHALIGPTKPVMVPLPASKAEEKSEVSVVVAPGIYQGPPGAGISVVKPRQLSNKSVTFRNRKGRAAKSKGRGEQGGGATSLDARQVAEVFSTVSAPPHLLHVPPKNPVYRMVRMGQGNVITSSTTSSVYGAIPFTLDSVAEYTDFTSVFDQYRVTGLEFWFFPSTSVVENATPNAGMFITAVDLDDAATPTTDSQVMAYSSAQLSTGTQGQYRKFVPSFQVATQVTGGGLTGLSLQDGWVDLSSATVQFFGLKYVWQTAGAVYTYKVYFRAHLEFRSTH